MQNRRLLPQITLSSTGKQTAIVNAVVDSEHLDRDKISSGNQTRVDACEGG